MSRGIEFRCYMESFHNPSNKHYTYLATYAAASDQSCCFCYDLAALGCNYNKLENNYNITTDLVQMMEGRQAGELYIAFSWEYQDLLS